MKTAVTVSLVTYEGARWLPGCLASLAAQDTDHELLVIDNASRDGTWSLLQAWAADRPRVSLVRSEANLGYAAAHNRNIAAAQGDVVLLLNQDTELDPGFLSAAAEALRRRPRVASVQGRVRSLGGPGQRLGTLDTTGLVMGRDRRAVSRGQGEVDGPTHAIAGPVWGADGPMPVYRRSALLAARLPRTGGGREVLDEDFFQYKEDVDLAWRLRVLGWRTWYEPAALGWHARGSAGTGATGLRAIAAANLSNSPLVRAVSWRNQRLTQVKNDTLAAYLRDLPWIASRELLSVGFIVLADPARARAVMSLARRVPGAVRKRRHLVRLQRRMADQPWARSSRLRPIASSTSPRSPR